MDSPVSRGFAANFRWPRRSTEDGKQLDLFHARPGAMPLRDALDLMSYPFFSLAKSPRVKPIEFRMGEIVMRVDATLEHGMATIWDADVLIWAASQIVDARDNGLKTSRHMAATPHESLTYIGRDASARDYRGLKAALDRLQSTTAATSIRQPAERRMHRFSWINEWKERVDSHGWPQGLELILPDSFYAGIMADAFVLTIDRAGSPRVTPQTRAALLATDVALTRFQPSPSGERAHADDAARFAQEFCQMSRSLVR